MQEETDTLRVSFRIAEVERFGPGGFASSVGKKTATFRAEQAQQKAEYWEAESATLRGEVARLGGLLADTALECEPADLFEVLLFAS